MAYPAKNTNGYTSPSKNSANFSISRVSGLNSLLIEGTYKLLIDADNYLLIEANSSDWSYQNKS